MNYLMKKQEVVDGIAELENKLFERKMELIQIEELLAKQKEKKVEETAIVIEEVLGKILSCLKEYPADYHGDLRNYLLDHRTIRFKCGRGMGVTSAICKLADEHDIIVTPYCMDTSIRSQLKSSYFQFGRFSGGLPDKIYNVIFVDNSHDFDVAALREIYLQLGRHQNQIFVLC